MKGAGAMSQRLICPAYLVPEWFLIVVVVMWAVSLLVWMVVSSDEWRRHHGRLGGKG